MPTPVSAVDRVLMVTWTRYTWRPRLWECACCETSSIVRGSDPRYTRGSLMVHMGMEALYRKPGTSKKHPSHEIYPYLLRGLTVNQANQVWSLDTTYIPMAKYRAWTNKHLMRRMLWCCRRINWQCKHQQRRHLKTRAAVQTNGATSPCPPSGVSTESGVAHYA